MALALSSTLPSVSAEVSLTHLFFESGRFSFFAELRRPPKGSPLFELSKNERGTGGRLVVGPIVIEASPA